jgi:hypothetical protein
MIKLSNSLNIYCDEFKLHSLSPTWIIRFPPKISIIRHFIKFFQSDTGLTNNWTDILLQQQLTTLVSWQIFRSHDYMTVCFFFFLQHSHFMTVVQQPNFLHLYTGRSCFIPGIHSWKMLRKSNTRFPFKSVFPGDSEDWQPHPIQCMTKPLVDLQTCKVYNYSI